MLCGGEEKEGGGLREVVRRWVMSFTDSFSWNMRWLFNDEFMALRKKFGLTEVGSTESKFCVSPIYVDKM